MTTGKGMYLSSVKRDSLPCVVPETTPKEEAFSCDAVLADPLRQEASVAANPVSDDGKVDLFEELDRAVAMTSDRQAVMDWCHRVACALDLAKKRLNRDEWERMCGRLQAHPCLETFLQDPFTRHAYERPRGYPGDAGLLDYIYLLKGPPPETTALGRAIFDYSINVPACRAVRERCKRVASLIDGLPRGRKPRIASIASGHLREADLSETLRNSEVSRLIVFDNDGESIETIRRSYPYLGHVLQAVRGGVRGIITGKFRFVHLDLVYAAGLFDYLQQPLARRLCKEMFGMLRPGGRLWLANFIPMIPHLGYMEPFMRWNLILRTEAEVLDLASEIPESEIDQMSVGWDTTGCIATLQIRRV
jgi:hypothetical protein